MLQHGRRLTAADRHEHAENIDPHTEAVQTMDKEAQLNRSSSRSAAPEESIRPQARMTGRPPVTHSPQRMIGRPPHIGGRSSEDRGRDHRRRSERPDNSRDRMGSLQDRFGGRLARLGDHRDRYTDRQNQSRDHQDHSRSRSGRPEAGRDRREDRQEPSQSHRDGRSARPEVQRDPPDRREARQDRPRTRSGRPEAQSVRPDAHQDQRPSRSRSRSARDRDQDRRSDNGQAGGSQDPAGPVVDSWPPAPKRRRAPLLGDRPPPQGMALQQPPSHMPPRLSRPQGAPPGFRVPCWRGPAPPIPPDEMDGFEAGLVTSNAHGGPQDSSASAKQSNRQRGQTATRASENSGPVPRVSLDAEAVASVPAVPEGGPSEVSRPLSLIDEILLGMQKEPEIAVVSRLPLRAVQPSNDDQSHGESRPVNLTASDGPIGICFDYFNHDVRSEEKEQDATSSSTSTVEADPRPVEAEARREVQSDLLTSDRDRQGSEERRLAAKDDENALLQKQVQEFEDRCLAMELEGQQAQEKHEKVLADQRAEISLVRQILIKEQAEVRRLNGENRRLQDAAVVHIDDDQGRTDEHSREVAQLRQDLEEQKRQAEEARKNAEEWRQKADEGQKEVQEQKRLAEKATAAEEEHKRIAEEFRNEAEEAKKNAEEWRRKAEEAKKDSQQQKIVVQLAQKEAVRAADHLRQSNEDCATLRQDVDRMTQEMEQSRKENAEHAAIIAAQQIVSKLAKQRKNAAEAQMNSMRMMLKATAERLREKRCLHCIDTARMAESLEHLQWDYDEANNAIYELMDRIHQKDHEISHLEGMVEILREQFRTAGIPLEGDLPSTSALAATEAHQQSTAVPEAEPGPLNSSASPLPSTSSGPPDNSSEPSRKKRAPGSEDAVRPSEAVPAGPSGEEQPQEPELTRKSAKGSPGPQQSIKRETVSQSTTEIQPNQAAVQTSTNASPGANRRSTDSGIGLDSASPPRPLAGPQSSPVGPVRQRTPSGHVQQTAGPPQLPPGPQQPTAGPLQQTGPLRQSAGPRPLPSGPQQQISGSRQQTCGPMQQTFRPPQLPPGPQQPIYGWHQQNCGHRQQTSGPVQQTSGLPPQSCGQQQAFGSHQPNSGPLQQLPVRSLQQAAGPPGPSGGSHLRAILERPPAAQTNGQGPLPGPPRCVAPPLQHLDRWLPPGLTPICWTPLICHIQGTQRYVEVAANAATGAPVYLLPNPQVLMQVVSNYNRARQAAPVSIQQPGRRPQPPPQQPQPSTRSAAPRTLADIPALAASASLAPRQQPAMPQVGPSAPTQQHAQPPILDALVDPQRFAQAMNAATPTMPSAANGVPPAQPSTPSSIWPPTSNTYPPFLQEFQQRGMAEAARGLMGAPGDTGDDARMNAPGPSGRR